MFGKSTDMALSMSQPNDPLTEVEWYPGLSFKRMKAWLPVMFTGSFPWVKINTRRVFLFVCVCMAFLVLSKIARNMCEYSMAGENLERVSYLKFICDNKRRTKTHFDTMAGDFFKE